MVDFCMYISFFCNTGETTNMLYEIIARFWDVEYFNKKTDRTR